MELMFLGDRCDSWFSTEFPGLGPTSCTRPAARDLVGKPMTTQLARARIAQAFGRLIRKADDKGVFVMLDAAAPSRLFSSLPEGVPLNRVSLVEAIEATARHVGS